MSKIEAIIKRSPVALLLSRHKKHADMSLYQVLTDCMEICEICLRNKEEAATLDRLIKKLPLVNGNRRQYVEQSSDIYQRTCRFMFHGEEHTANTNRYAITLREASKQGIKSKDLINELNTGGGINRFYLSRPNQSGFVATKCIRLEKQIQHAKGATIKLQLKRDVDNTYKVLEFSSEL